MVLKLFIFLSTNILSFRALEGLSYFLRISSNLASLSVIWGREKESVWWGCFLVASNDWAKKKLPGAPELKQITE